ncbi:MAG: AGE family epimerase/isomerase [Planctomycetes bacterium]|nr:AGE family epimerase/isomerase [Planctomycetota bacterium]
MEPDITAGGGPSARRIDDLIAVYRGGLLDDTLPFWIEHAVDCEHGGFLFGLDRNGAVIDTDKPMWIHGRFTWLLSTLCTVVEPRAEWLDLARHGVEFIRRCGFDAGGRMLFLVSREGAPLRKRRYLFTELFATIALAAYARAAGEDRAASEARDLFRRVIELHTTPGLLEPKLVPGTRPMKGLGMPMILINTAQVLRETIGDPLAAEWIERSIAEIERDFLRPEFEAVLETVGEDGGFVDTFEGRLLTPGHALEAGWFILRESEERGGDSRLRRLGLRIIDASWQWGWDDEHGGILYFRDVRGLPPVEYWHDMKFWWPQCEAILATLLAGCSTGDAKYWRWHRLVHDWAHARFPDREHGEWFGYLHRDGSLSTPVKGNRWKGPFHVPRMQLFAWKRLEALRAARGAEGGPAARR